VMINVPGDVVYVLDGNDATTSMNCQDPLLTNVYVKLYFFRDVPFLAMFAKINFEIDDEFELLWSYHFWT
jgi:hypothetical protein